MTKAYSNAFETRRTEKIFMIFYTIWTLYQLACIVIGSQPAILTPPIIAGNASSWFMYLRQSGTVRARAFTMASSLMMSFLLYGLIAASFSEILPQLVAMVTLIGLFNMPGLIYATAGMSAFFALYHLLFAHTFSWSNTPSISLHFIQCFSVFAVEYLVYFSIQNNLRKSRSLEQTIDALRQAEHSKDDFMANVSHEIRTPLNTICGMSELLLHEQISPQAREQVFRIQMAGKGLQMVISDVLDFSELESGKLQLVNESYNFTSVLDDILRLAVARNENKNLELIVDCDPRIPCGLEGDSEKLRRVISCFVDNAIKFTNMGSVCICATFRHESYGINLQVTVKDTGIGMLPADLERLFTNFNQVDTKKNRQQRGMGLGLAIAQKLASMMNGFISVKSTYKSGSEFTLVVPQKVLDKRAIIVINDIDRLAAIGYVNPEKYAFTQTRDQYRDMMFHFAAYTGVGLTWCTNLADLKHKLEKKTYTHVFICIDEYREDPAYFESLALKAPVILVADRAYDHQASRNLRRIFKPFYALSLAQILNGHEQAQVINSSHFQSHMFTAPNANVLVVDDNLMNLKVMEGLLRPYKLRLFTASGGMEALKLLENTHIDLIFMDHMMPQMDGIETLRRIRGRPAQMLQDVPVIALTANAIGGAREMFLTEGFQDFIAKPVEPSVLNRMLQKHLPPALIFNQLPVQQPVAALPRQAAASPAHDGEAAAKPSLLDTAQGMRYSNSMADYLDMLKIYYTASFDTRRNLQAFFEQRSWHEYTILVHALKSNSQGIGANSLYEAAMAQELAGKANNEAELLKNHDSLMQLYESVVNEIAGNTRVFPNGAPLSEQTHDVAPNARDCPEISRSELGGHMERLREAAGRFEDAPALKALAALEAYSYRGEALKQVLSPIRLAIQDFDFCAAIDSIDEINRKWGTGYVEVC